MAIKKSHTPKRLQSRSQDQNIQPIEKVELHQHVDGSIPAKLTWELMSRHGLQPVPTISEMEKLLVLQEEEEGSLLSYLDKKADSPIIHTFAGLTLRQTISAALSG